MHSYSGIDLSIASNINAWENKLEGQHTFIKIKYGLSRDRNETNTVTSKYRNHTESQLRLASETEIMKILPVNKL